MAENAIRWSPSSTLEEQRFLLVDVTGCSFRHCKVESYDGKHLRYETVSRNTRVPAFRAFDWSPHNESIFAVGEWSGAATVLRLDDEQSSPVTLPVRQQRPCNAIAFAKTGVLAVGLERVRNDACLNIWDVEHRLFTNTSPIGSPGRSPFEPVRKLASSEAITSIKFFHSQPDTLVTGVKGACIRLYDLRDNLGNAALQFLTTSVHNISVDPLNENYFASAGTQKDTTIQIWDRRFATPVPATVGPSASNAQSASVIEYKRAFEGSSQAVSPSIWSLRYCRGRSGYLGALASNGEFKIFETRQNAVPEATERYDQEDWDAGGQDMEEHQLTTKRTHHVESPVDKAGRDRRETARIVAFDFTNLAGSKGMPSAISLRGDKRIEIYELKGLPPVFAISSEGQMIGSRFDHTAGDKLAQTNALAQASMFNIRPHVTKVSSNASSRPGSQRQPKGRISWNQKNINKLNPDFSSCERHEQWFESQDANILGGWPLNDATRFRCLRGYLFDCQKNMEIVAHDPWLQDMWGWIGRAKRLAVDESLTVRGIDLSYVGVYNIWNVDLGTESGTRISGRSDNTDILLYAIEAICRNLELPEFTSFETSLPAHRRLCLHLCGFGVQGEDLDAEIKDPLEKDRSREAAFIALVRNEPKQALTALKAGNTSANRELSIALAGFVRGSTDDTWNDTIQDIASSQENPFAHAILAFVKRGSWQDVVSTKSLPLRFRVLVALLHLPDEDLTTYITTTTSTCIENGDIEGIVLTGLSEKVVPLLQNYILKYLDLQTAILAVSHTSPRYFSSRLVDIWRTEYRNRLNTHRLFIPRVRFDTGATALSCPSNGGAPTLKPPERQISLRCNHCDQALDRNPANVSATPPPASFAAKNQGTIFADWKSGTVCEKCGKHLPRCVICMLWLGMPDPHSKGGAERNVRAMERSAESEKSEKSGTAGDEKRKAEKGRELMKEFITVCRGCWHMMHAAHAEEWFGRNRECPVPGCGCRCAELGMGNASSGEAATVSG
ncbi:MAG: hypothetical protein Q9174_004237 [Haloplaca sp. 1 TL-2023]